MTNTDTTTTDQAGAHATDEPFGVVIKTEPHHRGHCSRTVGEINRASWERLAACAWADVEFRRLYRSRRTDMDDALRRTAASA